MKLEGSYAFNATRERVWEILTDPDVIARHLPGCESLTASGGDNYDAVLKIGVGAIKGTYQAKLTLFDKQPPEGYSLAVEGSGKPGFVKGSGRVRLAAEGDTTTVSYDGDLQIGGLIARVGQRIVGSISQKMTATFFESLGQEAFESLGQEAEGQP